MKLLTMMRLIFIYLSISIMFGGCAVSHGSVQVKNDLILAKIEVGKTTKADTLRIFGKPGKIIEMGNDSELWIYNYSQISGLHIPFAKHRMEHDTLYVKFNGDVARDAYRSESISNL